LAAIYRIFHSWQERQELDRRRVAAEMAKLHLDRQVPAAVAGQPREPGSKTASSDAEDVSDNDEMGMAA
jgi:hypothetical protein